MSADQFQPFVELSVRNIFRSHEHQMFKEVRKSCAARFFIAGTDVEPCVDRYCGCGAIHVEQYGQSVWKLKPCVRHLDTRFLCKEDGCAQEKKYDETLHEVLLKCECR